ncbi:MAG: histidinol-phosphate transaminase [Candidatus Alcyoniella australis]|nr:histidinol-phosphate transaminase [Candidatus Alcyoniella australis]
MARIRKAVQAMRPYRPPTAGRGGKLRLDFNENTLGPSSAVYDALAKLGPEDLATYPEYGMIEGELAAHLGVDPQQVVVVNATDEGIKLFLQTFVEPGSRLVLPVPTYAMFAFYAELCGVDVRQIPYGENFEFPTQELLAAMQPGLGSVIVCHPNNPTGTLVPEDALERILQRALEFDDAAVLVDEAYFEFTGRSALPLIERYPGLVVSRTFSKAFGMAGLRLGYLVSNIEAAAALRKAASPYSVNSAAVAAGRAALAASSAVDQYVAQVDRARPLLVDGLRAMDLEVHVGAANFVLARFGARSKLVQDTLFERGVLVRDRSADLGLSGVLRITIGDSEQVRTLLSALEQTLERRALLLDMDGVLVDVSRSYRTAIAQTAEHFLGRPVSQEQIQAAKQRGGAANDWELTRQIVLDGGTEVSLEQVTEHFQRLYIGTQKNPGLRLSERWLPEAGLLERLGRERPLAVVTARPRAEALWTLERFNALELFDALVCAQDAPAKPDPAGLVLALERLGCCAGDYAGDSVDDVAAARACGIRPIGVLPAGIDSPDIAAALAEAGAVRMIGSINELEE